uniref:NADH-ubiquinone oxidoreductase chain 5 n=1 Tax=Trioza urticae TaxID=121826 RepID=A0A344A2W2_TRIUR|nr:NADH dehydrogenase subunit 5 [Trioza urticae]AWU49103.1 NADH dehydrogenase subunit 5 [Trioza urticae]
MKILSKFYFISFFMSMICFMFFMMSMISFSLNCGHLYEIEMMFVNSVSFTFIIYLDWMSWLFMFIVLVISSLILVYSKMYMGMECHRFLWMTLMFIFFMLFMIMSPSVLGVLFGWDGLGIVSYCLVIYYKSVDSFNSGFITAATNRLGDSMLILSIVWFSMSGMFLFWEKGVGILFLVLACMTKSAQVPFSAWLPAAMAAPTPISSLVHSSTLVTAGVYLMIRFYYMFILSQLLYFLLIMSLLTVLVAGVSALKEYDLKRVIALSTLGQLGFMMLILCVGFPYIAFFHLLIHALFKALLFMCAGSIIHSGMMIQDLRKMGNLNIDLCIKISLNVSIFNLMGLPFTSGFYSKDALLEISICSYGGVGIGLFLVFMALITVTYCVRTIMFLSSFLGWIIWTEPSLNMSLSIMFLGVMNILAGGSLNWATQELHLVCLSFEQKILPMLMVCLGILWHGVTQMNLKFSYFSVNMFFMSSLTKMSSVIIQNFFMVMKSLDQGWLESILLNMKMNSVSTAVWMKTILVSENNYFYSLGVTLIMILLV